MTLDDLECQNKGFFIEFLAISGSETFQARIAAYHNKH